MYFSSSFILLAATLAAGRDVPTSLKTFYSAHIQGECANPLSPKFKSGSGSHNVATVYCSDPSSKSIFLKGPSGKYADMDIDCDGLNSNVGACNVDPSDQPITAFQWIVEPKYGIKDLDAHIHTYVVLGNDNSAKEGTGGKGFDPQTKGVKPLSLVAVVCGQKLVWGVWGDVNGGDVTGEASLSVGQMCYGDKAVNGDKGHSESDVLFIAFTGDDAVPGTKANWKAKTKEEFEASLAPLGEKLLSRLTSKKAKVAKRTWIA